MLRKLKEEGELRYLQSDLVLMLVARHRSLSGFHRRIEFGSYRPKLFARVACLSRATEGHLAAGDRSTVKGGLTS